MNSGEEKIDSEESPSCAIQIFAKIPRENGVSSGPTRKRSQYRIISYQIRPETQPLRHVCKTHFCEYFENDIHEVARNMLHFLPSNGDLAFDLDYVIF